MAWSDTNEIGFINSTTDHMRSLSYLCLASMLIPWNSSRSQLNLLDTLLTM